MSQTISVEHHGATTIEDQADDVQGQRTPYDSRLAADPTMVIYRISGAFFFGAASTVGAVLDRIADQHKTFILDFEAVPLLDSTGANTIEGVLRKAERHGIRVYITGASATIRQVLLTHGVRPPRVHFERTIDNAIEATKASA